MTILLRKFFPTFLVIFVHLIAVNGQTTSVVGGKLGISDYPQMPDSVMSAYLMRSDGVRFKLSDLRGKTIVLNLWAVGSSPSLHLIPKLIQLQKDYGSDRLEVLGLVVDGGAGDSKNLKEMAKFGKRLRIKYRLAVPEGRPIVDAIYQLAQYDGVPQTLVIAADGRLRAVLRGDSPMTSNFLRRSIETAQNDFEKLSFLKGQITDTYGSLIPDATILALAKDGTKFLSHTDSEGSYFMILPFGDYTIIVSKRPFTEKSLAKYQIRSGSKTTLDISLKCDGCEVVN